MKTLLTTVLFFQFLAIGQANAQQNSKEVTSVIAFFNPATSSAQCNRAVLGNKSSELIAFEEDGRIKTRLDVETLANGKINDLEIFINHRAFIPYFDTDKTPVAYEDGPQLVTGHVLQRYLPSIARQKGFFLIGYSLPYARVISDVELNQNGKGLYVRQTLESARKSNPTADEISKIRTAELSIDSKEIELKVTREYTFDDPAVPEYYKTTGVWTRDFYCTLQRY